jgi:hypothetical protein
MRGRESEMVRRLLVALAVLAAMVAAAPAEAWGPGGHAAIAVGVAQDQGLVVRNNYLMLQAVYGSSGPDFAWGATEPLRSALGAATHDAPGCWEVWDRAGTRAEKGFAWGWLSHNQVWGADYYAHLESPLTPGASGYVVERAAMLTAQGLEAGAAHDFVEVAIDLLLDQEHPEYGVGRLVSKAASSRDSRIPSLLARSYADVPGANWLTIRALESEFRAGMIVYGQTLALPTGSDDATFATGLAAAHGLGLVEAAEWLAAAKALCLDPAARYDNAITSTIGLVAAAPWPALP